MVTATAALYLVPVAASVVVTGGLAAYAWRNRHEPGALPFAGLMVTLLVWAGASAMTLVSPERSVHLFWERAQFFGIVFVPVTWLAFALSYTGYEEFLSPVSVGALSVVPVGMLGLVWTNHLHRLVWRSSDVVVEDGVATVDHALGPAFWGFTLYAYVLVGIAIFLFVRLVYVSDYLYADQSALLLVGSVIPLVSNATSVLGLVPVPGLDLTPIAFTVTGAAFGYALFRRRLFDLVPATRRLGRDAAIAALEDGVLVLDADDRIVYVNPAAGELLGCEPAAVLGEPAAELVDVDELDLDVDDALGELDRGGRTYEVRSSTITDRGGREIGAALVLHDVTARKRRERRLQRQRDELRELHELNALIRGVNAALVGATTREGVEEAVCQRLAASDRYDAAWIASGLAGDDLVTRYAADGSGATAEGSGATAADSGTTAADSDSAAGVHGDAAADSGATVDGELGPGGPITWHDEPPDAIDATRLPEPPGRDESASDGANERADDGEAESADDGEAESTSERTDESAGDGEDGGSWTLVPVTYGRTVYGALVVFTRRPGAFGDRELAVLDELGETVGHAINAAESRQLLVADAVTEIELSCPGGPLAEVADAAGCRISLSGVVPAASEGTLVYCRVEDGDPGRVVDAADDHGGVAAARLIEADGDVVELAVTGASALSPLIERSANVREVEAVDGGCRVVAEVAREVDVRALLERVRADCPGAELRARREIEGPAATGDDAGAVGPDELAALTDRQKEAVEAAYRAGYFEWPRETTAEDVAEGMGISSPTFHRHLRVAEDRLLGTFVDADDAGRRERETDDADREHRHGT